MVPASSQAKPVPDPAGTSAAVLWNWSMSTCSCVTNTVDGAAARKIDIVLRSSSVRKPASAEREVDDTGGVITEGTTATGAARASWGGSRPSRRQPAKLRRAREPYAAAPRKHTRFIAAPLFARR